MRRREEPRLPESESESESESDADAADGAAAACAARRSSCAVGRAAAAAAFVRFPPVAWRGAGSSQSGSGGSGKATGCSDSIGPCCYLKDAAESEPCPPTFNCTSWSRVSPTPAPPPPAPPSACPPPPPGACDRGWRWPVLNRSGCACTALALLPGAGAVAYPDNASLTTSVWEDRAYPWGGDALTHQGT